MKDRVEELIKWFHTHTVPASPISSHLLLPSSPLKLDRWSLLLDKAVRKNFITRISADSLLHRIVHGFPLGIRDDIPPPTSPRYSTNLLSARPELPSHDYNVSLKLLETLQSEIVLGRTAGPFTSLPLPNLQISPIGAVPKKNLKLRSIHHLSWPRYPSSHDMSVNDRLKEVKCEYVSFERVIQRIGEIGTECLLAKFDVKDAFRLLRIVPSDQYLLGIFFYGFFFYERCLPFGIHPGPALFEEFSTAIEAIIHSFGVRDIPHYADDFLHISTPDRSKLEYRIILNVFDLLGVPLALEKLSAPSRTIEFLGIMIDTQRQVIYIPSDKMDRYRAQITEAYNSTSVTIKCLESLIGVLRYSSRCVQHGSLFLHHLQANLTTATASASAAQHRNHRHTVTLTYDARRELSWWKSFMEKWNGVNIIPPSIERFPMSSRRSLLTDACNTGMGGWMRRSSHPSSECPQYLLHAWTEKELHLAHRQLRLSMPYLELLSVILSVYNWREELADSAVDLQSDCKSVVDAINNGYSRIPQTHQLLLSLFLITNKYHIFLSCTHIAGVKNVEADALSRSAHHDTHRQSLSLSSLFFPLDSVSVFHSSQRLIQKEMETLPLKFYGKKNKDFDIPL